MKLVIAVCLLIALTLLYSLGMILNNKVKIDCKKIDCGFCKNLSCINRSKEE